MLRIDEQAWTEYKTVVTCLKKSGIIHAVDSTVNGVALGKMKILMKAVVMMSMTVVMKDSVTDRTFRSMTAVDTWILFSSIFLVRQHC
jgi:hypothetical protein